MRFADLVATAAVVGYESLETTGIYAQPSLEDTTKATEKLSAEQQRE